MVSNVTSKHSITGDLVPVTEFVYVPVVTKFVCIPLVAELYVLVLVCVKLQASSLPHSQADVCRKMNRHKTGVRIYVSHQ